MTKVGDALRRFRERRGLSQREMAAVFGTSASNIGAWETGVTRVSADAIGRIKGHYPELWEQLVELKLGEIRSELGLEGDADAPAHGAAVATLQEIQEQIRQALEELQSDPPRDS